jgi:hypothetical protein
MEKRSALDQVRALRTGDESANASWSSCSGDDSRSSAAGRKIFSGNSLWD